MKSFFKIFLLCLFLASCGNKDSKIQVSNQKDPYLIYNEGLKAFEDNDYFFASKKFSEAELNFEKIELAAKSAIMSSYCLYNINFYNEALEVIERYETIYPSNKNMIYAQYLKAIIYYEQISDEKRDLKPLLLAKKQIEFFLSKYPNTDYAIDLGFKKDLIQNQLAAKELFVAKFYISTQKWIPAINRLKIVISDYEETIFVEEALHRLVEVYYNLGLISEAEKTAKILGYNYNSSEWYENSYSLLNKDYKKEKILLEKKSKKYDRGLVKKTIDKILNK